jgi:tetraacyldisaccharide 4'-kinase
MFLPPLTRPIFYLPAKLYAGGIRARAWLYENAWLKQRQLAAPVISIGNLSVGGTGKTPCVAWLANRLQAEGQAVAILSRGYKRASAGRVEVSDGRTILCDAQEAGDEPYLLARACPGVRVVVDRDRYEAGKWLAERAKVSIFLLDDGYQHLRLHRDLNLLLLDATESLADLKMVPFGRLREPLTAMRRADAVIMTHADQPFAQDAFENALKRYVRSGTPVFSAQHTLTGLRQLPEGRLTSFETLAAKPVAAFSGIARPEQFIRNLHKQQMQVVWQRNFPDHHRYTTADFESINKAATQARAAALITTEKDAAKLAPVWLRTTALPIYAAQLEFHCAKEEELWQLICQIVSRLS